MGTAFPHQSIIFPIVIHAADPKIGYSVRAPLSSVPTPLGGVPTPLGSVPTPLGSVPTPLGSVPTPLFIGFDPWLEVRTRASHTRDDERAEFGVDGEEIGGVVVGEEFVRHDAVDARVTVRRPLTSDDVTARRDVRHVERVVDSQRRWEFLPRNENY